MFSERAFGLEGPDLWDTALPSDGKRQSIRQHGPIPQRFESGVDGERSIVIQASPQRVDVLVTRDVTAFAPMDIPTLADAGRAFDAAGDIGAKVAVGCDRVLSRIAVATEALMEFEHPGQGMAALSSIHPGLPITAENIDAMFMRSVRLRLDGETEANLIERWRSVRVQTVLVQVPPQPTPDAGHPIGGASTRHVLQFEIEMNTLTETPLSLPPGDANSLIQAIMGRVRFIIGTPC